MCNIHDSNQRQHNVILMRLKSSGPRRVGSMKTWMQKGYKKCTHITNCLENEKYAPATIASDGDIPDFSKTLRRDAATLPWPTLEAPSPGSWTRNELIYLIYHSIAKEHFVWAFLHTYTKTDSSDISIRSIGSNRGIWLVVSDIREYT